MYWVYDVVMGCDAVKGIPQEVPPILDGHICICDVLNAD